MRIDRFPCDPGPAAWKELLPPAPPRDSLKTNLTADWLIIGAGFAGLSAARRLRQLHSADTIVVLEASSVAEGPAGRNSGFMIDLPHDLTSANYSGSSNKSEREIRLNRAGIQFASEAATEFAMDDEAFTKSGRINGAMSARGKHHNDVYAKQLDGIGESYTRLNANDMQRITGTSCYRDGLFTPGTAMIQPAKYIQALANGVERLGVMLYEQTPVQELNKQHNSWLARSVNGTVSAGRVILCVNGHLESFGFESRSLMHVFTYASMTRALTNREVSMLGGESRWALTPADALGTTVRRISGTGRDRIIIRNRATFDASLSVNDDRIRSVSKYHDRSYSRRFPMLASVPMEYRWGGRLCLTKNNVAVFGEIDNSLYSACCQNGLGTAKGSVSGMLAAELASDISSTLLDDQLADEAPKQLPPKPIASIAANAILRWGEFRAGVEF